MAFAFGGMLVVRGLLRLRAAARAHPESRVYMTLEGAPIELQRAWLRRFIPFGALGFAMVSVMSAWDLWQLEHTQAGSVRVWAPVALIYDYLGFYPAVLAFPVIGVLTIGSLVRRKRRLGNSP